MKRSQLYVNPITECSHQHAKSVAASNGDIATLGDVQPIGSLVWLAGVNVHHVLTVVALHGAAPHELALTLGDTFDTHGVVTPSTAHDLAAVCAS